MNLKENKRLLTEILKIARFVIVAVLLAGVCIYVSTKYKQAAEPEIPCLWAVYMDQSVQR